MMRWGSKEAFLESLVEIGQDPEALKTRVKVWQHLTPLMESFHFLSIGRPIRDGSEGYIQISEMLAYCQMASIESAEAKMEFMECIRQMDYAFMEERKRQRDERERLGKQNATQEAQT